MSEPQDPFIPEEPVTPPNSAVDDGQRKRRLSKQERMAREDAEFFRATVASEIGRRFLWSILNVAHPFETIFSSGPSGVPDPMATMYHHGEQQLGLRLYQTWMAKDPMNVHQMLVENDKRFQKLEVA